MFFSLLLGAHLGWSVCGMLALEDTALRFPQAAPPGARGPCTLMPGRAAGSPGAGPPPQGKTLGSSLLGLLWGWRGGVRANKGETPPLPLPCGYEELAGPQGTEVTGTVRKETRLKSQKCLGSSKPLPPSSSGSSSPAGAQGQRGRYIQVWGVHESRASRSPPGVPACRRV